MKHDEAEALKDTAQGLTRGKLLKAGGITVLALAVAVYFILSANSDRPSPYPDLRAVCVQNPTDLHGFNVTGAELGKHLRSRTTIKCPVCKSEMIARATPCVACGENMPAGAHDLPPDFCPYCGEKQPYPTISDHASIHAPGAHGEETLIIPLLDDPEPQ